MQEWRLEILLLLWLVCINGAPILLARWAGQKFNHPIDGNRLFIDGRPLLGASKTFRGLAAALCVSVVMGMLFAMPLGVSLMFGALSMAGDMTSSFIKRRLGLAPSSMALGLDQIPEALFPLLGCQAFLALGNTQVALIVLAFVVVELLLSPILFKLGVRATPY